MKFKSKIIGLITAFILIGTTVGCGGNSQESNETTEQTTEVTTQQETSTEQTTEEQTTKVELITESEELTYNEPLVVEKSSFAISSIEFVKRLNFFIKDNSFSLYTKINGEKPKYIYSLQLSNFSGSLRLEIQRLDDEHLESIKLTNLQVKTLKENEVSNITKALIKTCNPTMEDSLVEKILKDTDIVHSQIKYELLPNILNITPAYGEDDTEIVRLQEIESQKQTTVTQTIAESTTVKLTGTEQEVKTAIRNKIPKDYQNDANFLCEAYLVDDEQNLFDIDVQVEIGSDNIDECKNVFYKLLDSVSNTGYNIEMYSFTFLNKGVSVGILMAETGSDVYTILKDGKTKDFTK